MVLFSSRVTSIFCHVQERSWRVDLRWLCKLKIRLCLVDCSFSDVLFCFDVPKVPFFLVVIACIFRRGIQNSHSTTVYRSPESKIAATRLPKTTWPLPVPQASWVPSSIADNDTTYPEHNMLQALGGWHYTMRSKKLTPHQVSLCLKGWQCMGEIWPDVVFCNELQFVPRMTQ